VDLLNLNGAKSFTSFDEFSGIIENWLSDESEYLKSSENASRYVKNNTGATRKILNKLALRDINNLFS
jgi:hypothetical protein